jgi:hypothetical protein
MKNCFSNFDSHSAVRSGAVYTLQTGTGCCGGRGRRIWASDWFEAWAWQRPGAARGPTQWPQRPATERACPGVSLLRRRPKCLRGAPSARRSRGLGRGCHQARADLQPEQTFVVIPGDGGYPLADGVPDLATPGIQRPRPGRPKPAPGSTPAPEAGPPTPPAAGATGAGRTSPGPAWPKPAPGSTPAPEAGPPTPPRIGWPWAGAIPPMPAPLRAMATSRGAEIREGNERGMAGSRATTPSWERNLSLAAGGAQRCALFLELDSWSWVVDGLNLGTALSALAA